MSSNKDFQNDLIKDFILESLEGLESYDRDLLAIEKGEGGSEILNNLFRVMHSIKGTAGCLGLSNIEGASHRGEDIMSLLREGEIEASEELISTLLSLSDVLRSMLENLEQTGDEGEIDNTELFAKLENLGKAATSSETPKADEPEPETLDTETSETANPNQDEGEGVAFGLFDEGSELEESQASPPDQEDDGEGKAFGLFDEEAKAEPKETKPIEKKPKEEPADTRGSETTPTARQSIADSAIRVDVSHLDKVMNIVGELVLARNQILLNTTNFDQAALLTSSQRLNIITTELQESVMKTRMQPIRNIWSRFPRITRDLAHELDKRIKLIMDGQDTELDRTLLEAIKDPLTHIIRNSIDHGIEKPDERKAAGKPEEGLISLRAYHEGGQVNIEIMDDGAGINVEAVKAKAIAKNLINPAQAERLSDREAVQLIFAPGFSTAERISNVSGRGVGMDVVKTNIEKIGGSVDLQTEKGQGAIIKIKIPLTLAIIPALIVTSGGDSYAIPQVSLLELVRLELDQGEKIEVLSGAPVYRLRGQLLPIVRLNDQLQVETPEATNDDGVINIVVLQADGRQFGLVVDEINDTEEIVVKPLGKQLKGLSCFSGATIMGDGKVALILDVLGLAQYAHVISESKDQRLAQNELLEKDATSEKQTLLLFEVGQDRSMAIPLSLAARLEEFPMDRVEKAGSQSVIQYRDQILPLVDVENHLAIASSHDATSDEASLLQVIVYSHNGNQVGLIVSRIKDILETEVVLQKSAAEDGILGSAIIQDKVTDLLDVKAIVQRAVPNFGELAASA